MSQHSEPPVFFDQSGWRTIIVTAASWAALTIVGVLVATLVATAIDAPVFERLKMSHANRSLSSAPTSGSSSTDEPHIQRLNPRTASAVTASKALRFAHLVTWDPKSFASLKRNAANLDVVVAEWLSTTSASGEITHIDADHTKAVSRWVTQNAPSIQVYVQVNNYNRDKLSLAGAATDAMLASSESRIRFISEVTAYAAERQLPGVVLDFEGIDVSSRDNYLTLVTELKQILRERGIKLVIQVGVLNAAFDYAGLAEVADALILMTYDEHVEIGGAGPLAGQGWFEAQLREVARIVDPGKLIISIGSYAYDWAGYGKGKELSVQEAWSLIGETRSRLQVDARSLNPMFVYRDDIDKVERTVWFLDGVTAYNHVAAALAMQPAGLALWRLGTEDPTVWATFGRGRMADAKALERLVDVPYSADVIYKGEGEVLSAAGEPRNGVRSVTHDASQNLITAQAFRSLPTSIVVTRDGARSDEKLIALTFDDGPDSVYTPRILDILAQKDVKGSFFIVGSMGVLNKDLIRRIYLEGHDIGNHTFTHINSSNISAEHIKIELNATQRLIEATVGVRTRLFRPPYATDIEPQSIDSALPLKVSSEMGYITIGMKIDPKDWLRTDPQAVIAHTLNGARKGDGNVVLLHDSGGLRSTTIKALPVIIDTLKSEGFRFVTIHELLGLPRSELMPASDPGLVTSLNLAGFSFLGAVNNIGYALFYLGIALGMMRLVWVAGASIVHKWRERARAGLMYRPKRFTVIVPAYNEAKVIEKTVRSILASNCSGFRVLVVDDGSSDCTADLVEQRFANDPRVRVLRKTNGGKWSALNAALQTTTDDVIVTLDADTVLDPHALRLIVRHFGDPKVGAVAGHASIGNINNLLTRFQAIEYITNQNLDRRALELVNGITVVPGAIGAWRRKALLQIGGFEADTLAEDADATVRLGIAGWRVLYEPDAIARTEAPETVRALCASATAGCSARCKSPTRACPTSCASGRRVWPSSVCRTSSYSSSPSPSWRR